MATARDHPKTPDRINDMQGRIRSMAGSSGLITDEPEFHEAKVRIAPSRASPGRRFHVAG